MAAADEPVKIDRMTPVCPRCSDTPLVTSSAHGVWVMHCAKCWGLWIDHASVRQVVGVAIDGATAMRGAALRCPLCRGSLRAWKAKGVIIDRCDAHGVWFDRSELEQLIAQQKKPAPRESSVAADVIDSVAVAVPIVDAGGELADGATELAGGAAEVVGSGVEVAAHVAEAGGEAAGGVFDAVGAIFDIFS